jgi:ribulose-5-phosphate 4-epimerase/fuculose-1-phosphate aldolase
MLRNHGLLTVGKTIADAFLSMYTFENTCRIQIDAQAGRPWGPCHRRLRGRSLSVHWHR